MPPTATRTKSPKTTSTRSTKTSSRKPARAAKRPKPLTIDHFRRWASLCVLDNGSYWPPEDFQLEIVEDLLAGADEVWAVLPEGNGKTTLMSGVALYHGDYTPDAMVVVGASSRDQCKILHDQAAGLVRRTPGLDKRFRVFDGYRQIRCLRTGGLIQVFAADDRTGDGVIPTLALLEELHRQRNLRLYRTWRGKLGKRGGQLGAISTAGEADSEFEELRKKIRTEAEEVSIDGAHVRAAGGGVVLHDWAVPEDADITDMKQVKAANPLSMITPESLAKKFDSPTTSLLHWQRFVCNQPVRQENSVISEKEWQKCEDRLARIPEGTPGVIVPIDLGWKWDTTAIVPLHVTDERVQLDMPTILTPPRDGTSLRLDDILAVLREAAGRWPEVTFVLDPEADGEILAQHLDDEGLRVATHSQKPTAMALAAQRTSEAISSGRLCHPGHAELTRHVLSAAAKPVGEGYRFVRPKRGVSIDGCIALAMGVSVGVARLAFDPSAYRIELV